MKVCVFADEVSRDFDEALTLAKLAGAESVEIRGGLYGGDVTSVTPEGVLRMKAALAKNGMTVASIGSPFGKCHHDRAEEIERQYAFLPRLFDLGQELECRLIRVFAFWNPQKDDRACLPEYLGKVVSALRPAVEQAESAGFILGLELAAETFVATAAEFKMLHDALGGSLAFQVVWDLGAEQSAGETPYPDGYIGFRGHIAHVHIKPNAKGTIETVPGSTVTHREVLQALRNDGYTGAVSIEHWGSSEKMLEGVRQLRSLMDQL